eukprot:s1034_g18.t1
MCVAGVAVGEFDAHFERQAWQLVASALLLRGRRGIYGRQLARGALGRRRRRVLWRGRRGAYGAGLARVARLVATRATALCAAGVALCTELCPQCRPWPKVLEIKSGSSKLQNSTECSRETSCERIEQVLSHGSFAYWLSRLIAKHA